MTDHPDIPTPGHYLFRRMIGRKENGRGIFTEYRPCRIWYGPPVDPEPDPDTGEEVTLDRSWRWQALLSGTEIDVTVVWPWCALTPISEEQYLNALLGELGNDRPEYYGSHDAYDWETSPGPVESTGYAEGRGER